MEFFFQIKKNLDCRSTSSTKPIEIRHQCVNSIGALYIGKECIFNMQLK